MNERRVHRLENQIKARVAEVLQREVSDPQLGFVTVSGVQLDREIKLCKVFWSILGSKKDQLGSQRALDRASGFIRRQIAQILHTRTVPEVRFIFDESIEGSIRVDNLLAELQAERESRQAAEEHGAQEEAQEEG
jgi:ribosome-binding factor A